MAITYDNTSKTITVNGTNLHYHEVGQGPALLLLHGSGPGVTAWANFSENLEFFSKNYRCIALDLPGYGKSAPISPAGMPDYAKIGIDFLQALNISQAHIVGNSMGGIVGSHMAAIAPQAVATFTTIGGIGLNIFNAFPAEGLNLLTAFAEDPSMERLESWLRSMVYDQSIITPALLESRYKQALDPVTLASTRAIYSRESIGAIAKMRQSDMGLTGLAYLARIQAPTLLVWGRDDRVSPLDGCLIPMRMIPRCELHTFPNCGHWAMIERKKEFEILVRGFIQSHS